MALRRVGEIQGGLNTFLQSEPIFLQVIDLLNGLGDPHLDNPRRREELAAVQLRLAGFCRVNGRTEEAARYLTAAHELYQGLSFQYPGRIEYEVERAKCLLGSGRVSYRTKRYADAEQLFFLALEILESSALRPQVARINFMSRGRESRPRQSL